MEKPLEQAPSKKIWKLSLKPISTQILIIVLWMIAAIIAVYYVTYEEMTFELIRVNILPRDLTFLLILAGGLAIIGAVLLLTSKPKE